MTAKRIKQIVAGLLVATVIAVIVFWILGASPPKLKPVSRVTVAVPILNHSAPMIVALNHGEFKKAGVEVISRPFQLGKDALKAVIDGQADLAIVADTPFVFALLGGNDIAMLASISQSRRALAIVTRNDRGIKRLQDLRGKSVGLTMGTNLTYFFDAMLQVNDVPSNAVSLINLKPDETLNALKAGDIDAAALFQPYLARIEAEMGDQIKVFYGDEVYAFRFLLVGKPSYIDRHPEEVQRILRALSAAVRFIHEHPERARHAVGEAVKLNDATMIKVFDPEDFELTLDQALLLALDDQTRWAMQRGLVKTGPVPNYLNFMKYQYLEAVSPDAVKIVR